MNQLIQDFTIIFLSLNNIAGVLAFAMLALG